MRLLYLALAMALAAACGEAPPPKPADTATRMEAATKQMGEAAREANVQKMGEAVVQMGDALAVGSKVEPVDHRALRALLPENIGAMRRENSEGSKTTVMGLASSKAVGTYADGKGARLSVEILDVGSFTGVTAMAFAWVTVEIDKEGDDGYERTSTVAGRRAYERYSRRTRSGEVDVIVASRFVVSMRATGIDAKAFRAAVDSIDFAKLDALKK